MKMQSRTFVTIFALAAGLTLSACSSKPPMGDIASTANPREEIARLETDLKAAQSDDVDVLAFKDYDKAVKNLEEAKSDLASNQKQEEIINDLRTGRAALVAAKGTAQYRKTKAPSLFVARQAALSAGVAQHPELQKAWTKNDREVIEYAEDLSKLNVDRLAAIQNHYVELERSATILTEVGGAKAQIASAEEKGAKSKAPQTLKTAKMNYANAESIISTNVRNPAGYQAVVDKTNASARMLTDVMSAIILSGAKKLPEATAIKMVMQTRQVADLKNDLSDQRTETEMAASLARSNALELSNTNRELSSAERAAAYQQSRAESKTRELSETSRELGSAEKAVAFQQALDKARQEFSTEEAETYQKGDSLIIRLKTVSFPSGRAELPGASLPVLAKVSDVAKELGAAKIRVQGHTDSIGGQARNQLLSEKRANAVATYFKANGFDDDNVSAEGFGLTKPLASNKSQAGRKQNRRVDIVITPQSTVE